MGSSRLSYKDIKPFAIFYALAYYLIVPIIYLVSILPFAFLYLFSDFLYFNLYYVFSYRKKVIEQNLRNSFPEKTDKEIKAIQKDFYRHFCDFVIETIKMLTVGKAEIIKRCKLTPEASAVYAQFAREKKSVILVMGHFGNWEWACNSFNAQTEQQLFVIYHPLSNTYFDALMQKIRMRNGSKLIAMKDTYREMTVHKNGLNVTAFLSDQTPHPDHAYWTTFLNQDTPVFKGVEVISKKMKLPVVFTSMRKVKRGYYEMISEILIESPEKVDEDEVSEMYIRKLEEDIRQQPEIWLWSHKRWKHKRA
ncbi:MAG TPA: lysophospholipid acyltransferase family protein [Ferruginibacter sp.]|nr:lysophospholipid acyltransferase family protein [Ferruginibacter sp.]